MIFFNVLIKNEFIGCLAGFAIFRGIMPRNIYDYKATFKNTGREISKRETAQAFASFLNSTATKQAHVL